jgi:hypothetical protein
LVSEIDSEEEVDYASGVGCRRESEESVLHGCVICAEEDGVRLALLKALQKLAWKRTDVSWPRTLKD